MSTALPSKLSHFHFPRCEISNPFRPSTPVAHIHVPLIFVNSTHSTNPQHWSRLPKGPTAKLNEKALLIRVNHKNFSRFPDASGYIRTQQVWKNPGKPRNIFPFSRMANMTLFLSLVSPPQKSFGNGLKRRPFSFFPPIPCNILGYGGRGKTKPSVKSDWQVWRQGGLLRGKTIEASHMSQERRKKAPHFLFGLQVLFPITIWPYTHLLVPFWHRHAFLVAFCPEDEKQRCDCLR